MFYIFSDRTPWDQMKEQSIWMLYRQLYTKVSPCNPLHLSMQFLSDMPGSYKLFLFLTATLTASNLTTMLEGGGSGSIPLMRHVSSVGEHVSSTFQVMPIAKRAETFAGFDTTYDISKGQCIK